MKMSRLFVAALAAASCTAAFAQSTVTTAEARDAANLAARNNYPVVQFQSGKTRADVRAELVQAQQQGLITNGNDYPIVRQAPAPRMADMPHEASHANTDPDPTLYQGA